MGTAAVDVPLQELVVGGPVFVFAGLGDGFVECFEFGVQVVQVGQDQRLQCLGPLRGAVLQLPVVADDHVQEFDPQPGGKSGTSPIFRSR